MIKTLLNVHSNYSIGYGANHVEDLCHAISKAGYKQVALTDINNLYHLFAFQKTAARYNLKIICASHLKDQHHEINCYVQTEEGFSNLCQLISKLKLDETAELKSIIPKFKNGIRFTTPDIELAEYLFKQNVTDLHIEIHSFQLAILRIKKSRELGIRIIASHPVYMISKSDFDVHKILQSVLNNLTLSETKKLTVIHPESYLISPDEFEKRFEICPDAVENLKEFLNTAWYEPKKRSTSTIYLNQKVRKDAFEYLRELTLEGAKTRYGNLTEIIEQRIDKELNIIQKKGFSEYFLTVRDIIHLTENPHCGRGSAAASIISYCLGITEIDPIKYNLYFERFLNMYRTDPPDIDIDFGWDERDDILTQIFEKYGEEHCAMVSNHVLFQDRMAIREIAKAYGIPELEIQKFFKQYPSLFSYYYGTFFGNSESEKIISELPPVWQKIIFLAKKINGFPRYLSVHCGGFVVTPDLISKSAPIEKAPKGVNIVQWEKDQTEDSGLIKIDILGNRSLSVIRDIKKEVQRIYDHKIDFNLFNLYEDQKTIELLASGNTMGVFYVESPAMRQLQQKTKFGDFDHMIIHSSIIRPAANKFINEYVERLHGKKYEVIHPLLKDQLEETYGIMCYQEDVIKAGITVAGMHEKEATQLLKSLTDKYDIAKKEKYKKLFFEGCLSKNIPAEKILEIWEMIQSFAGYSFCKPHSASYVVVSFQSAYLKQNFPAEFIASVISNQGGFYSAFGYISEARRLGVKILLPDINASEIRYVGYTDATDADSAKTANKFLRVGLMQLKNIERNLMEKTISERNKSGKFTSLHDYIRRLNPDLNQVEIMIKAGCFDSISNGKTRPELMWETELYFANLNPRSKKELSLFEEKPLIVPKTKEYSKLKIEIDEQETLGFLISNHPLSLYQHLIENLNFIPAKKINDYVGKKILMIGWFITRKVVYTKQNDPMQFASFEDTTAIYETVFFPEAYKKFCTMISDIKPYKIWGMVTEEFDAVILQIERIAFLE